MPTEFFKLGKCRAAPRRNPYEQGKNRDFFANPLPPFGVFAGKKSPYLSGLFENSPVQINREKMVD